eukprot:superscaffoldBa00009862_g24360
MSESWWQSYIIPRLKGRPSAANSIVLLTAGSISKSELGKQHVNLLLAYDR